MTPATTARSFLVTGATRGVGAAVVDALCGRGDHVLGVVRSEPPRVRPAGAGSGGHRSATVRADLGHDEGIEAVLAAVADGGARLDGVVLAAGIAVRAAFDQSWVDGVDPLREQLRVDLQAPLLLVRALLRADALAASSSIVFVSSNLARRGLVEKVAYSAAKAGLEGATRGLARELGPVGIRVNAVAPGLLRTDMNAALDAADYAAYAAEVPLRRVGEANDAADVILFLLGPAAAYVTGQVIDVDGGWAC